MTKTKEKEIITSQYLKLIGNNYQNINRKVNEANNKNYNMTYKTFKKLNNKRYRKLTKKRITE